MSRRMSREMFLVAIVIFIMCTTGCVISGGSYVGEEPFTDEQVRLIHKNETTKEDILAWFGPPAAVARKGDALTVPPPGLWKKGSEDVRPELFFDIFSQKHELTIDHIVYYYHASSLRWLDITFYQGGTKPTKPMLFVKKLWILINEKTGKVEDFSSEAHPGENAVVGENYLGGRSNEECYAKNNFSIYRFACDRGSMGLFFLFNSGCAHTGGARERNCAG